MDICGLCIDGIGENLIDKLHNRSITSFAFAAKILSAIGGLLCVVICRHLLDSGGAKAITFPKGLIDRLRSSQNELSRVIVVKDQLDPHL